MKLMIEVTDTDGDKETLLIRPRTQVAYERHFSAPGHPVRLGSEISMEGLYWLAWHASGDTQKFDKWLDTVESVRAQPVEEGDSEPDPFDRTPSSGPLSTPLSSPVPESPTAS